MSNFAGKQLQASMGLAGFKHEPFFYAAESIADLPLRGTVAEFKRDSGWVSYHE